MLPRCHAKECNTEGPTTKACTAILGHPAQLSVCFRTLFFFGTTVCTLRALSSADSMAGAIDGSALVFAACALVWLVLAVLSKAKSKARWDRASKHGQADDSVHSGARTDGSTRSIQSWGSPILAMAPMVGQSDYPFRLLCRRYGTTVCWTEMLMADQFAEDEGYRVQALGRWGIRHDDHPLVVQFAANTPHVFAAAAVEVEKLGADGVDLNLGCPQRRARTGHYGSYLTDPCDWALCCRIVSAAAAAVSIPVTVKIRLQGTCRETVDFAVLLAEAGASLLTLHARHRGHEDRRRDGAADLTVVAAVVARFQELGLPCAVLSNGNVRCHADVEANLKATGAAGLMVAEQLLRDPAVFGGPAGRLLGPPPGYCGGLPLALEYAACLERAAAKRAGAGGSRRLRLEDGASDGGNHNRTATRACVKLDEEFERYSVWWNNYQCVSQHLGHLLPPDHACVMSQIQGVRSVKSALRLLREWASLQSPAGNWETGNCVNVDVVSRVRQGGECASNGERHVSAHLQVRFW